MKAQWFLNYLLSGTFARLTSIVLSTIGSSLLLSTLLFYIIVSVLHVYRPELYDPYFQWVIVALFEAPANVIVYDYLLAFLALIFPMTWMLVFIFGYSNTTTRADAFLLSLRVVCCSCIIVSLVILLTELMSRRTLIVVASLCYGTLGLLYSWSVSLYWWQAEFFMSRGLLSLAPAAMQNALLNCSIYECMKEYRLHDGLKYLIPFLLPLERKEQLQILKNLPAETQEIIVRPGLIKLLPDTFQRAILPRDLNMKCSTVQVETETYERYQLYEDARRFHDKLKAGNINAGFEFAKVDNDVVAQQDPHNVNYLVHRIIERKLLSALRRYIPTLLSTSLHKVGFASAALMILQLYMSRKSRRLLVSSFHLGSLIGLASTVFLAAGVHISRLPRSQALLLTIWNHIRIPNGNTKKLLHNLDCKAQLKLHATASMSLALAVMYLFRRWRR